MTVSKGRILYKEPQWQDYVEVTLADYARTIFGLAEEYRQVDVAVFLEEPHNDILNAFYRISTKTPNVSVYARYQGA